MSIWSGAESSLLGDPFNMERGTARATSAPPITSDVGGLSYGLGVDALSNPRLAAPDWTPQEQLSMKSSRPLIDLIQEDFPRTPSPALSLDPHGPVNGRHLPAAATESNVDLARGMRGLRLDATPDRRGNRSVSPRPTRAAPYAPAPYSAVQEPDKARVAPPSPVLVQPMYPYDPRYLPAEGAPQGVLYAAAPAPGAGIGVPPHGVPPPGVPPHGVPPHPGAPYAPAAAAPRLYYEPRVLSVGGYPPSGVPPRGTPQVVYYAPAAAAAPSGGYKAPRRRREEGKRGGRGKKGSSLSLESVLGRVVAHCRDQHGSRFIQQRLESGSEAEKASLFREILPEAQSLMTDVFGNYVVQKLFEYGDAATRESLAALLRGHALRLSLQMYGCRVVQKCFEFVDMGTLLGLIGEFDGYVLTCVQDQNGNHVIQKSIEVVCGAAKRGPEALFGEVDFIVRAFDGRVRELAMHAYGCRVIQRILEHASPSQKGPVLDEILDCLEVLIRDQYGNYVTQHLINYGRGSDRDRLVGVVAGELLSLSRHKFASNVVEKCLQYGTKEQRDALVDRILAPGLDGGASAFQQLVQDPYGNYVVQRVIDVADSVQRAAILTELRRNAQQLRRVSFGKHIISKIEKLTGERVAEA